MRACFISSHSLLLEKKTGVQIHDINIIKSLLSLGVDVRILDFNRKNKYKTMDLLKYNDPQILKCIKYSIFPSRISKHIPLVFSFGKNAPMRDEVCIVDSIVPKGIIKNNTFGILHDLMPKIYPENYSNIKPYLDYLDNLKQINAILANSESTKKDYLKFYSIESNKIKVLPCCISNNFKENLLKKRTQNNVYSYNYFYYIGDMRKNKNLAMVIEAFSEFASNRNNSDYKLVIAGNKSKEYFTLVELTNKLNCSDKVMFTGYISEEEKANIILGAKCLIFVSDYEGFGIPILEAMACGIPVITSNTSSMAEIGEGSTILVNPKDKNEIVASMEAITSNNKQREYLIKNGYERVKKYTDIEQKEILGRLFWTN